MIRIGLHRESLWHEPDFDERLCAGGQVGVEDSVGDGAIGYGFARSVFGVRVGRSKLQSRRAVSRGEHEVRANVNRSATKRGQFAYEFASVRGVGVVRFVVSEIAVDRLERTSRFPGVDANGDS